MTGRIFLAVAGAAGAISVAADAAATHLLAGDAYRLGLAATASRYGMIHAAALLALAFLIERGAWWLGAAGWCFVIGLVLFCGSLDLLAAGAPHIVAHAAPWGGTAFILGWLAALVAAARPTRT
ncbi:MAG TPA: DUF423 domain-containing protein [Stellaceae bacterium]|nr:DUF423 domain-containing protein [Stellaceae bacterium]